MHRLNILACMPNAVAPRGVDVLALSRHLRRLYRAEQAPWLHAEVARRMAERLDVIRLQPARVIDWQAKLSASAAQLRSRYPKAQITAVDAERAPITPRATGAWRWWPLSRAPTPALLPTELQRGQADLLWANMALHTAADPVALFKQWHAAIAVDGFLMFSTLGPGTLVELSALYRRHGWPAPMAPFVDMHDLGDMLIEAGFADPVMDQETLTLSWADAPALLAELRSLGGNASPHRAPALRTPAWLQRLSSALTETAKADGRPALSFEIVYGHAFRVAPKLAMAAEASLSPEDLRTMARQPRASHHRDK